MKRRILILLLAGLTMWAGASAEAAAPKVNVTGNVLAESIVKKGSSPQIKGLIAGFKAGTTASFQSLTTLVFKEQGVYNVSIVINGPDKKPRAYYTDPPVEVKSQPWTHFIHTYWQVNFNIPGIYDFVITVNNSQINTFSISAN